MKANLIVILILVIGAGIVGFTVTKLRGETVINKQTSEKSRPGSEQSPLPARAPEHVVYRQFFRHLLALKEHAVELDRQGKTGNRLRQYYKDKIKLSDNHARLLDQIAADCDREVARLDLQAKAIIQASRIRFPNGKVPPGQRLPPPPPELKRMQLQRNLAIIQARDRLREAVGDGEFQKINDFIKVNFAPNVKPAQINMEQ